jgi:1,2-diacylglycerol 3-alpha-glucosyltransferase
MLEMVARRSKEATRRPGGDPLVVVIWIDWYAYHVARFRGLLKNTELQGNVLGLELVGGIGVHEGLKFREDLPAGMPVETLLPANNWSEARKSKLALEVWRRLSRLNPKVVLVPGYYTLPAIAAALWARLHNKKSVLMTESTQADHDRSWWKETIKGILIRSLFNWAVAGGEPHAAYLEELGFRPSRIGRFYDVVDNDYFRAQCEMLRRGGRQAFGLPQHYFVYVGRLAEEKNVAGLLKSYVAYRKAGGTWHLVLVGSGPQAKTLRQSAADSAFSQEIHFAGHKSSGEISPYYSFADCFILPSTREPWGLVVNEAMATGLPVIVSNRCGCVRDLVEHGRNGLVFDPFHEGDLSDCMHLLENFSCEKRDQMGALSSERIKKHSPETWALEIARIVTA